METLRPRSPGGARVAVTLGLVFVLALLLRLGVAAAFQGFASPPDAGAFPDQVDYEAFARALSEGRGYTLPTGEPTARRPPGTSLAILPAYLVFGRSFAAARVWFCVLSAATCLAVGWFAARAFGALAGALTALLLAFDPAHFYYAQHLVSEVPFCFFAALAAVGSLEALRAERLGAALLLDLGAGVAYALAALTRPQMLLAVLLGVVVALAALRRRGRRPLVHALVAGGVVALVAGAWVARNAAVLGTPTFTTTSGVTFWGAHNEHVTAGSTSGGWVPIASMPELLPEDWPRDEEQRARVAWREGLAWVRSHAGEMPRLLVHKLRRAWTPWTRTGNRAVRWSFDAAWWLLVPASAVGLLVARRRDSAAAWILYVQVAVLLATVLVFYGHWRFRHSIEPWIATFAATAFAAGIERLRAGRRAAELVETRPRVDVADGGPHPVEDSLAP